MLGISCISLLLLHHPPRFRIAWLAINCLSPAEALTQHEDMLVNSLQLISASPTSLSLVLSSSVHRWTRRRRWHGWRPCLLTFETDDLLGAQGFTEHFEPQSTVVEAVYEKGDMLSCVTPSWDLSTPSLLFQEQTTHMHVVESDHGQSWFGSPSDSKKGRQLLQNASLVRFVHINREPWFWGHDVHVNARTVEHGYSLPTWAGMVMAGVNRHDKVPLTQVAPHLFASDPRLSRQGSLEFKISADQFGEALIRFRLSDNGGNKSFGYSRFPPIPSTVRLFKTNVYAPSARARTVDFTIPSNITIYEGSGKHILPHFVEDFTSGVPHPQVCSHMVAHDHDC
jgi:hypothetical protein